MSAFLEVGAIGFLEQKSSLEERQIQVGKSAYSATLAVFSDFTFTVLAGTPTFT